MIKILSDSSSLYSKKEALANGTDIASLSVTINNINYKEYEEIHEAMNHTKSYLIPNDFDYLVGKIGGLMKLVPITTLSENGNSLLLVFPLQI